MTTYIFDFRRGFYKRVFGICAAAAAVAAVIVFSAPQEVPLFADSTEGCFISMPPPVETVAIDADVAVHGTVTAIHSAWGSDGHIHSVATVAPFASLGGVGGDAVVIETTGGTVDGITEVAGCEAKFHEGEEVVVVLDANEVNGAFRVQGGLVGKFTVRGAYASRGIPLEEPEKLSSLRDRLAGALGSKWSGKGNRSAFFRSAFDSLVARFFSAPAARGFVLPSMEANGSPPVRWLSADIPVPFYMNTTPYPSVGQATFDSTRAAYAAWSNAGSAVSITDAGYTATNDMAYDSRNIASFGDPSERIPSGYNYWAYTWWWYDCNETVTASGTEFCKILETDILVEDGITMSAAEMAGIMVHEVGHAIGLGHSTTPGAVMQGFADRSGGAVLSQDDIDGVRFIYPLSGGVSPDLVAQSITLSSVSPTAGDSLRFSSSVKNQATVSAGAFSIRFCIDDANCLTSTANRIGSDTALISLAANATSVTYTSSAWVATAGSHTAYFCADTGAAVSESSESNNCSTKVFTVGASQTQPDLIVESLGYLYPDTENLKAGDSVGFFADVVNQGLVNAAASFTRLRLDIDSNETWDVTAQNAATGTLTAGSYESEEWLDVWAAVEGTHTFEVCADTTSSVTESDETNNCTTAWFTVASLVDTSFLPEGALIRAAGDFDVYIVKYVGVKKFKRLILSPSVFNNYGHLHWEDIIEVSPQVRDAFVTSDLVRAVNDPKVYKLFPQEDTGEKRWIPTAEVFLAAGLDWDAIYEINEFDRDSYVTGADCIGVMGSGVC